RISVRSTRSPDNAVRTSESMQARKAASVLPEPVGAEMRVVRPARMVGQPCSCGSVGVPNLFTNHSRTTGWAQARLWGMECIIQLYTVFVKDSPSEISTEHIEVLWKKILRSFLLRDHGVLCGVLFWNGLW